MRTPILKAGVLGIAALASACGGAPTVAPDSTVTVGSGIIRTETRPVQDFTAVSAGSAVRVIIDPDGAASLQITADDNILPLVEATVSNGRLILGFARDVRVSTQHGVVCRVRGRQVTTIEASGSSRVEISRVDARVLTVRLSGASALTASGSADELVMDLSGASRFDGAALRVGSARIDLSGASVATVRVVTLLTASASGVSILEFFGDPIVRAQTSGGSVVRRVGS